MATQTRSGTNWVKNLPNYTKYINNEKREELGWQSPFEVYFGRKSYELVRCGLPKNRGSPEVRLDLKKYARKQGNKHLIATKGLKKNS